MNDQLILKFPSKKVYLKEDYYVSSSNQEAYDFINSWPKWVKRIVNVFGPTGSGKTHIASLLKNKTSTLEIKSSKLNDRIFYGFKTKEALIIEDVNEKISEKLLFSIWNIALQDNKYLLITSLKPISAYQFKLSDLKSRVDSFVNLGRLVFSSRNQLTCPSSDEISPYNSEQTNWKPMRHILIIFISILMLSYLLRTLVITINATIRNKSYRCSFSICITNFIIVSFNFRYFW